MGTFNSASFPPSVCCPRSTLAAMENEIRVIFKYVTVSDCFFHRPGSLPKNNLYQLFLPQLSYDSLEGKKKQKCFCLLCSRFRFIIFPVYWFTHKTNHTILSMTVAVEYYRNLSRLNPSSRL